MGFGQFALGGISGGFVGYLIKQRPVHLRIGAIDYNATTETLTFEVKNQGDKDAVHVSISLDLVGAPLVDEDTIPKRGVKSYEFTGIVIPPGDHQIMAGNYFSALGFVEGAFLRVFNV